MTRKWTFPRPALPDLVRALRYRNYRFYFSGQLVSVVGTWTQQIAMSWLVYRLTGSVLMLGVVAFAGQIPVLFLAPLGGLWVDRVDRRLLLLWTQSLSMAQALLLAVLTLTHAVQPWHLVALALLLGAINAVDVPARQSFVVRLIDRRDDLPNAIALNSLTVNAARFLGPSIGGLVVSVAGEAACFLINAVTYLTVIIALAAIRVEREAGISRFSFESLRAGVVYAFGVREIRVLLGIVAAVSFTVTPYTALMPYFAKEVFGGGPRVLGVLMSAAGVGALIATLYLASRKSVAPLPDLIAGAAIAAGAGLALFTLTPTLWLAVPFLLVVGSGVMVTIAASNTLIQTIVRDELRGRVMSIFTVAFLGIAPIGSLVVGSIASVAGTRPTLLVCGAMAAVAGWRFRRAKGVS